MRRDVILAVAGVVWLVTSVHSKAVRYGNPPEPRQVRAERMVVDFLHHSGWEAIGRRAVTSDGAYSAVVFGKHDCDPTIAVAVLGGAESAQAATTALGNNVAYLLAGEISATPQFGSFQRDATLSSALALLGGPLDTVAPVMGIWPAPSVSGATCDPPRTTDWGLLARLKS